ncbi:MAG: hypothetical protein K2X03_30595 [Bryobacteraceae bacterium]|nr:hypothetical protein [Bryobacteraceae bacterium]
MAKAGVLDEKKYGTLLDKHRPRRIQTPGEHERLSAMLEELDGEQEKRELDAEEREFQELLALLVTEYEDRVVIDPQDSPLETLKSLMEDHGLRAVDLLDVFGSPAVASQVLNGHREISKSHARRLADRFKLSVDAFVA